MDKNNNHQKVVIETQDYDENAEVALPQRPTPLNLDTFFRVVGTYGPNAATPSDTHKVDYNEDSYYYNGYQTIFLKGMDLKDGDIIRPLFYPGPALTIYAGTNAIYTESPVEQETGVTEATYRGIQQPIQYSAASKEAEGMHLKNYWVTFVTPQTGGAKLFVNGVTNLAPERHYDADRYGGSEADQKDNGLPVRELILDSRYLNRHDIVVANIGDQSLTGIRAWIVGPDGTEESANVMIDAQYALDGTASLPAFSNDPAAGFRNITQIRIVPKDNAREGLVSGYLKISADGQNPVTVKLTGVIGDPKIVTQTLSDGVKYVHYSSVIQTSNLYDFDPPVLEVVGGNFPQWATLKKNGEIYGMPTQEGQWTFKIRATFYDDPSKTDEREYTLTVLPNSTQNVWNINDYKNNLTVNGAPVVSGASAATYDLSANPNLLLTLHSDANLEEFVDKFTVDGEELTRVPKETPDEQLGENEYKADEGSIIATIRSQTLRNAADGSTHTLSLENRANQDLNAKMTRTSVNVTVKKSANSASGGSGSGGGSGGGGSSSGGSSSSGGGRSSGSSGGGTKSASYSVSVKTPSNGSLTVSRKTAASGATVTVTARPKANYALENVTVTDSKGAAVSVSGSGETRTFVMPARRVTVSATFVRLYRVSAMSLDFGWVEVKPEGAVPQGTKITLTAHPESGYRAERLRAYMGDTPLSVTGNGNFHHARRQRGGERGLYADSAVESVPGYSIDGLVL